MLMHLGFSVGFISQVLRQAPLGRLRSSLGLQLGTR
jgi:hypothetical protein